MYTRAYLYMYVSPLVFVFTYVCVATCCVHSYTYVNMHILNMYVSPLVFYVSWLIHVSLMYVCDLDAYQYNLYIYSYICVSRLIHVCDPTPMCIHIYVCRNSYMYVMWRLRIFIYMCVVTHTCMWSDAYVYVYICVSWLIHVYDLTPTNFECTRRIQDSGIRIGSVIIRVQGLGLRVEGWGLRVEGWGFRVWCLGSGVLGLRFRGVRV